MACIEMTGKRKINNGKEGCGQQFPSINVSSVLTVCASKQESSACLTY